jgi:hypothetical protein
MHSKDGPRKTLKRGSCSLTRVNASDEVEKLFLGRLNDSSRPSQSPQPMHSMVTEKHSDGSLCGEHLAEQVYRL